ncbi:hypothetical protein BDR03DRAFT_26753 [Suillus americanus]|nr:hypothetical protein BDR03DRAFT_26753 [Suillus americanus]
MMHERGNKSSQAEKVTKKEVKKCENLLMYLLFLTSKYIFYEITSPGKTGAMFYRPSDTEHQFIIRVLVMQKIYQLCPRLFCVALHCELKLKGRMREIRNVVSM